MFINKKAKRLFKNFSLTLIANFLSLIISASTVLIVPRFVGVDQYGYFQLFLFYSAYSGFLLLGWNDGIYLRYGGKRYENLNKDLFFSQLHMSFVLQAIIAGLIIFFSLSNFQDGDRLFVFTMLGIETFVYNSTTMLSFILQATNRIKPYALITIYSRVTYFTLVLLLLFLGYRGYKFIILANLLGRMVSFFYAIYACKELYFRQISSFYFSFQETIDNIKVGIKLMFSNIASMLLIGVVRFGIERTWDIATFGKVSLTLSASKLVLLFINAVGVVIYPVLRRTDENKYKDIYNSLRDFLMLLLLGVLLVYNISIKKPGRRYFYSRLFYTKRINAL